MGDEMKLRAETVLAKQLCCRSEILGIFVCSKLSSCFIGAWIFFTDLDLLFFSKSGILGGFSPKEPFLIDRFLDIAWTKVGLSVFPRSMPSCLGDALCLLCTRVE
jgi:hypothetical protein